MTLGKSSGFIWLIISDQVIACKLKYSTGLNVHISLYIFAKSYLCIKAYSFVRAASISTSILVTKSSGLSSALYSTAFNIKANTICSSNVDRRHVSSAMHKKLST